MLPEYGIDKTADSFSRVAHGFLRSKEFSLATDFLHGTHDVSDTGNPTEVLSVKKTGFVLVLKVAVNRIRLIDRMVNQRHIVLNLVERNSSHIERVPDAVVFPDYNRDSVSPACPRCSVPGKQHDPVWGALFNAAILRHEIHP